MWKLGFVGFVGSIMRSFVSLWVSTICCACPLARLVIYSLDFDCDSGISPASYWLRADFPLPCLEGQGRQSLAGLPTVSTASGTRCQHCTPRASLTGCRQKASMPCSSCTSPGRRCVQRCASDTALWHCDLRQLFFALSCSMPAAEMENGPKATP